MNKETYRNREDVAREYVESVKACNDTPTWDLLHTAVIYGMECERRMADEFKKSDCLAYEIQQLGANVGDVVKIIKRGSGWYNGTFDSSLDHKITGIDWTGHVEFDDGVAVMYRPEVEIVSNYLG